MLGVVGGVNSFKGPFESVLHVYVYLEQLFRPINFALNLLLHRQDIRRCVIHFIYGKFPAPTISCPDLAFVHVKLIPI
jgi:hypothetical protein